MKKVLLAVVFTLLFTSNANAKEDYYGVTYYGTNPDDWKIYTEEKGEVIKAPLGVTFSGKGMKTGYRLNLLSKMDREKTVISWQMSFKEFYAIYIGVYTTQGKRVLRYTALEKDIGKEKKGYISFGLGSKSIERYFTRDLQKDLDKFEHGNKIIAITAFMVRGSGKITDLTTDYPSNYAENLREKYNEIEIKSGESPYGGTPKTYWSIFTKDKGTIEYMYTIKGVRLSGKGMKTGYKLSLPPLKNGFNTLQWDMKFSEEYAVYILVQTTLGVRHLRYSPANYDKGKHSRYISFGLGSTSKDGKLHPYRRNLQKDLNKFEPNNKIISIKAFIVRGSGEVGNIKFIKDSALLPIKNFDNKKFDKLLNIAINQSCIEKNYECGGRIHTTEDPQVKYIDFYDIDDDNWTEFFTLSSDQTKLRTIYSTAISFGKGSMNVMTKPKLNSDHTIFSFDAQFGYENLTYYHFEFLR